MKELERRGAGLGGAGCADICGRVPGSAPAIKERFWGSAPGSAPAMEEQAILQPRSALAASVW